MHRALLSASVYTGAPDIPWAQAILIKDDRIQALGTNEEIQALAPPDTEFMDLSGRFIAPGFVDAHTHVWSLGYTLSMVDLRGKTSLADCLAAIKEAADKAEPGSWVLGRNWNQNIWKEGRDPNRHDLDQVCPDNPAVMIRICGHANWCNTKAFEAAGVTADTQDPYGGKIDREANGYPAGVIRETREVVEDVIPVPDLDFRKKAFLKCQEIFLSHGITCVHSFETPRDYEAIHAVMKDGNLKMRVYHTVHPQEMDEWDAWAAKTADAQSDFLWHGHIKMFADGSLGARSAHLHAPYLEEGGKPGTNCGIPCMTPEDMRKNIRAAYDTGRSVIFHAIGDAALTESLNAIEDVRRERGETDPSLHQDRIEHLQLVRPEDLARMEAMDIAASVQPMAIVTDWKVADEIWGAERCTHAYPWKSMTKRGLRLIFSSDAPIEPISPLEGIQAAMTRRDFKGELSKSWHPEHCLDMDTALHAYFSQAGWATGRPKDFGTIAPGKKADLTILEADPFSVPKDEIRHIKVTHTLVNGKWVYGGGQ
ncbi:MAG: amidohydrolase [Desulfobacterales bacterium]|nr:amidohydrolase [Desulfobacterales bacterium]